MADPGRVASGANLLAWLEREGCEHCVRLGETPGAGGVGVFATRDVERGEILISCPTRTVISAAETRLDVDPGMKAFAKALDDVRVARGDSLSEGTPLDDSTRMQLLLLRERHTPHWSPTDDSQPRPPPRDGSRGEDVRFSGYWATYARSLPGDELVASLPSSWSEPELERRLGGTSLFPEVLAERAELFSLAAALKRVFFWRGDEEEGEERDFAFARGAFGVEKLRWARAVFRSRAIALPLAGWGRGGSKTKRSGGDDGALVPLLDMCNHARDAGTSLERRGAVWRLVATRRFTRDEEVRIDYGGKGNGELLTRHGFVIPNNPFDTCSYRIGDVSFTLHRGVREWREFPPGARDAAARFLRETRGASFLGESTYDTERASIADSGGGTRRKRASSPDENERDVIVLTFLAESARRLSAAIVASPGKSFAESVSESALDASGFATSSTFLTERACAMVRESQRELLSDLEDLARETIEATRTTTRLLDDATTTKKTR